jgi:hypothetical protein
VIHPVDTAHEVRTQQRADAPKLRVKFIYTGGAPTAPPLHSKFPRQHTGLPRLPYLGSHRGPRGGGAVSYERGTPAIQCACSLVDSEEESLALLVLLGHLLRRLQSVHVPSAEGLRFGVWGFTLRVYGSWFMV